MLKRYSYRAYPNLAQVDLFNRTFGSTRVVYNKYIESNKETGKLLTYNQACSNLTLLKKQEEYAWLNEVPAIALQQALKDATQGVSNYFKAKTKNPKTKTRVPGFKKRSNRQSFRIVDKKSFKVLPQLNGKWGQVKLPKLDTPLKYRMDRPLPAEPNSVSIIREPSGEYYVSFVVEEPTREPLPASDKHAGIDVGLTSLATIVNSNGEIIKLENPRWYRASERRIKKLQRSLSRKQKGSKNREEARQKLAREHQRIANRRLDYYRKLSLELIRENQSITLEHLNILLGMIKNHRLAKSISDAGWYTFKRLLIERAVEYGRDIYEVDQYYPSTQTCSHCGVVRKNKLKLSKREWDCSHCGAHHDRDVNAAINILTHSLKNLRVLGSDDRLALSGEYNTYNFIVTPGRGETLTAQVGSSKTRDYPLAHSETYAHA